jgi:hypothetical protein
MWWEVRSLSAHVFRILLFLAKPRLFCGEKTGTAGMPCLLILGLYIDEAMIHVLSK